MKENIYIIVLLLATGYLGGCSSMPMFMDRTDKMSIADDIANQAVFSNDYIKAGDFLLMTYHRFGMRTDHISIYIEGDGRAWETKHQLSQDPTPTDPVALRLAAVDPADNIAYIARPGQYYPSSVAECDSKYWSGSRFAPEVIDAFNSAIDQLKEKSQARYVELIGFSGGGAIAVLVAARRSDVVVLRTVAGNLNTRAFCKFHRVSELTGSMEPMQAAQAVSHIPQRHYVGSKDFIVPGFIVQSFVKQEGDSSYDRITTLEGAAHTSGWQEHWKDLLSLPAM